LRILNGVLTETLAELERVVDSEEEHLAQKLETQQ
jgi:hypothetical protein